MKLIKNNDVVYAIIHKKEDWKKGLDFLTPNESFCQVGTWWYPVGEKPRAHRHIQNIRPNKLTQECVIVMNGSMRVDLYDNNDELFHAETLKKGDLLIVLKGGHGYEILEPDTMIIECKNGPFLSVEKDKTFINDCRTKLGKEHGVS